VALLMFLFSSSSCSFYLVISPLASLFFCFSYNYFFSFTFPVFISFIHLSSTSHVSSALPFVSFYFYLRCLPPHTFVSSSSPLQLLCFLFAFYCPQTFLPILILLHIYLFLLQQSAAQRYQPLIRELRSLS